MTVKLNSILLKAFLSVALISGAQITMAAKPDGNCSKILRHGPDDVNDDVDASPNESDASPQAFDESSNEFGWMSLGGDDLREAASFLLPFMPSFIPYGSKALKRALDATDKNLLTMGFEVNPSTPIETGVVELLDKDNQLIDQKIVIGQYKRILGLNSAAYALLAENRDKKQAIATIRKRHTHPQNNEESLDTSAFSKADISADRSFRNDLDRGPYKHVRFESWIVFTDDSKILSTKDIQLNRIHTRGYLVPAK
jgi:hypothetical protein